MPDLLGSTILHYKVVEKLGEGGMGVVYKAEDTKLKREVAIKFLPHHVSASTEERKRFENEAQAAAALNHPNISTIHSIEEYDDPKRGKETFIVMEYVDGQELKAVIASQAGKTLSNEKVLEYAIQIAKGLETAHEKGIIHRDIKSSNIMITSKDQIKIMDFGLAKMGEGTHLTKVGTTVGTVAYMSPEQALGKEADAQSDIWAFGVVLYEMIAGHLPFEGAYEQSIVYSIINDEPVSVSEISNCPPFLEKIIMKCMSKDLKKRYQNFSDILVDLQNIQGEGVKPSDLSTKKQINIQFANIKNRRKPVLIISAVILTLILVLAFTVGKPFIDSLFGSEPVLNEQHLAVLPLSDIGGGVSNQAFCNGIMETLTSNLTQLQQFHKSLWVIPVSEVLRYKIKSPGEANQVFGVNLAVTGSLQQVEKNFQLTLNLIDAKNLRQLNSSVIEVKESNLADLQNKSVISLLQMLNLQLNPKSSGILEAGNTDNPEAYEYYLQGRGYLQDKNNLNDVESAVSAFFISVQKDSLYAVAHSGLAQAYWWKYKLVNKNEWAEKAVKESDYAFKLNSKLAYVNITLGIIHNGTGKYKESAEDFNRALVIDPVSFEAYQGLAIAYENQGDLDEAEKTYKRAISMQPDNWYGYKSLGIFYYNHSRYNDAIVQFKKAIEINPKNYTSFNALGAAYYFKNDLKNASDMFERAFKIKQSYLVASNLGTLYYIQGKYSEAARKYEKALEINSSDYIIWGNLGAAYYWANGERDKAKGAFLHGIKLGEEARKINPKDPELLASLAGFYSMVGEKEKALDYIKKSLDISPIDADIMFRTGTTYEKLGDRKKAISWIIKAIENGYSKSEVEQQPELKGLIADPEYKNSLSKASIKQKN